jgi:hypothetical protein
MEAAMSLVLIMAAALQAPAPQVRHGCGPDTLEHASGAGALYRREDPRNSKPRNLVELPDAHLVNAVYRRDERGCPVIDVVQRNVSRERAPSQPERRLQRDR